MALSIIADDDDDLFNPLSDLFTHRHHQLQDKPSVPLPFQKPSSQRRLRLAVTRCLVGLYCKICWVILLGSIRKICWYHFLFFCCILSFKLKHFNFCRILSLLIWSLWLYPATHRKNFISAARNALLADLLMATVTVTA
jgi:hypothetical protein